MFYIACLSWELPSGNPPALWTSAFIRARPMSAEAGEQNRAASWLRVLPTYASANRVFCMCKKKQKKKTIVPKPEVKENILCSVNSATRFLSVITRTRRWKLVTVSFRFKLEIFEKVLTVPHQWTLVSLCVFWFCAWLLFSVLKGQMGMHYVLKTMFKPLCVLIKLQ